MNSHSRQSKKRERWFAKGQAIAEMAAVTPVLVLLLLAAVDFGRLYYTNIEVVNAARAGAQYGSQSVTTAANAPGMRAAALQDASNVPGMSAVGSQCTCETGSNVTACPASYCTNSPNATFVIVNTTATYSTIVSYPGIPHTTTLTGKAVMIVEE